MMTMRGGPQVACAAGINLQMLPGCWPLSEFACRIVRSVAYVVYWL
jgi:hypothetical protein